MTPFPQIFELFPQIEAQIECLWLSSHLSAITYWTGSQQMNTKLALRNFFMNEKKETLLLFFPSFFLSKRNFLLKSEGNICRSLKRGRGKRRFDIFFIASYLKIDGQVVENR
jgi:hypothetical protein